MSTFDADKAKAVLQGFIKSYHPRELTGGESALEVTEESAAVTKVWLMANEVLGAEVSEETLEEIHEAWDDVGLDEDEISVPPRAYRRTGDTVVTWEHPKLGTYEVVFLNRRKAEEYRDALLAAGITQVTIETA
jgi:hypothetical protein